MNELKPCPFCGGDAEMDTIERYDGANIFFVKCTTCQMTMPLKSAYSEAIAAWNSRAGDDTNVATNADRIRSMSDEELAEWLVDANMCERVCIEEDYCGCDVCVNRVTDWLKQPAKEEHHEDD
jgi:Lar family restriction alleviation protein